MTPQATLGRTFLAEAIAALRSQKDLAGKAVAQVSDDDLHVALDEDTNSVAVIMKHLAGNLLSRWSDFLSCDGEKPWRNRDGEFVDDVASRRGELLALWEKGWTRLFETLSSLRQVDLAKTVTIRGEPHTVVSALLRATAHVGYHVGQIVLIARHLAGEGWTTLGIGRGKGESEKYNRRVWKS